MSEGTTTYYIVNEEVSSGNYESSTYYHNSNEDKLDWLCYNVAKTIAFSDITHDIVKTICYEGRFLEYIGWQPNMLYEFVDGYTGDTVWSEYFPQWDH